METSIVLQEKTLLSHIFHHPNELYKLEEDLFISGSAKIIYKALAELHNKNLEVNFRNLAIETTKQSEFLTEDKLSEFLSYDSKVDADKLLKNLADTKTQYEIRNLVSDSLLSESFKKSSSIDEIAKITEDIQDKISKLNVDKSEIYSAYKMLEEYEKKAIQRLEKGTSTWDTGCSFLNSLLTEGFAPQKISIIFGASGSGKSTFGAYLINKLINKQLPCYYASLEMDLTSTVDRLIMMRHRIPMSEFIPSKNEDEIIDSPLDAIIQTEKELLGRSRYFRFSENPDMSIMSLRKSIKKIKKELNVDYLIVLVDLLTMLKDFNKTNSKANDYEHAMNLLHEMVKEENVHLIGIVQSRRPNEKVTVKSIDDVDKFVPQIEQIKNSAAIEERSRIVLSVFRPKFFLSRVMPEAPELDIMDDVMEIRVLKQNNGRVGVHQSYLFDGLTFHLEPIQD